MEIARAAPRAPSGWPIFDADLIMAFIGPVMVVYQGNDLTGEAFDRHVVELARTIDERKAGSRVGVVYHLPGTRGMDAARRKRVADLLEARREILGVTTAGYALATPSSVVRGLLRAVFWVASPPYPYEIVSTPREAFAYIATKLDGVDVDASEREYARLQRELARSMSERRIATAIPSRRPR